MSSTAVITVSPTEAPAFGAADHLRYLALRAVVVALVLATVLVGMAGMAWAGPEMGC